MIFEQQIYPARTITVNGDMPDWLTDYKIQGPARHMDMAFNLVMISQDLERRIECVGLGGIYADAIVTSMYGGKAAIKDATITHCFNLDLTLVGGVFVLQEGLEERNQKMIENDETLKRFQIIDLEE